MNSHFLMKAPQKKFLIRLAIVVVILGVLGIGARPAFRFFKLKRAHKLLAEVQGIPVQEETVYDIVSKAKSAYQLAPHNLEVNRKVAEILEKIKPQQALAFWESCFLLSGGATQDRIGIIRTALNLKNVPIAKEHLRILNESGYKSRETEFLRAHTLALENDIDGAIAILGNEVNLDSSLDDLELYIQLTQFSRDSALRQRGVSMLWALSKRDDLKGMWALRNLSRLPGINEKEMDDIIESINNHPMAFPEDELIVLQLKLARNPERGYQEVLRFIESIDSDEIGIMLATGRWLNKNGLSRLTRKLIPMDVARKRHDLFLVLMDSMAIQEDWESIELALNKTPVPLEEFLTQLFLARSYWEQNKTRRGNLAWNRVILTAKGNPEQLFYIADYGLKLKMYDRSRDALEALLSNPTYQRRAAEALIRLEQSLGNTEGIYGALKSFDSIQGNDHVVRNDLIYTELLLDKNLAENMTKAEQLVQDQPGYLAHYVTLALAYLKNGKEKEALRLLKTLNVPWEQVQPRWRAIYAAVLKANNEKGLAKELSVKITPTSLLPEEQALLNQTDPATRR